METRRPRALSRRPMLAAVMPFPSEEVTPPVTKTYFAMGRASGGFSNAIDSAPPSRIDPTFGAAMRRQPKGHRRGTERREGSAAEGGAQVGDDGRVARGVVHAQVVLPPLMQQAAVRREHLDAGPMQHVAPAWGGHREHSVAVEDGGGQVPRDGEVLPVG